MRGDISYIELDNNSWEDNFKQLWQMISCKNVSKAMMIGDSNMRISTAPGVMKEVNRISIQSKVTYKNTGGKKLLELCEAFGFPILNGT